MRTAFAMVILLLLTGLVQHPQTTELADEMTVYSTDNYNPVADMTLGANQAIAANIVHTGTKTVSGQDWDVYRLTLDETGQLNVELDANNSSDPDATAGNGIVTYEWKVFFDAPYGDTSFNLEGHTFEESAASNGLFTYSFQNVTVSQDGTQESQIRLELRVYDAAGKYSDKFRMYFVVVPNDWGDDEPVFQIDASNNMTSTDADVFYINGTLVSGSESGDVYVEGAFSTDDFEASAIAKYNLLIDGLYARSDALSDGDTFSLTLSIDGFYTNLSETLQIYIRTYEGDNYRWVTYHWFEITLMACQGLVAPQDAISAGGEFILDEDGECQWDGAWTYDSQTGQWEAPEVPIDPDLNSTLSITEVGPFKSSVDTYSIDGVSNPVLYLKESFHIDALLTQANGQVVGGKCLNIYLDPEENTSPIATAQTDGVDGTVEWFSGDPLQNPTLLGVEVTGGNLEGLRTLKVAYEPNINVSGGCDADVENALNGSEVEIEVLVRSRVDFQVLTNWYYGGEAGIPEGQLVVGEVALLRDRLDLAIENEEVQFIRQYRNETGAWVTTTAETITDVTNEQGIARFEWSFDGQSCDGVECTGEWRVTATYLGSQNFQATQHNISYAIDHKAADEVEDTPPVEIDEPEIESIPGFEVWLLILAMLFAVSFRRKLNV
ncbi:MAG: hypothetical protein CMA18_003440 [Methanobacteriota archaeon]|nr:MAG: hypothetical protein CBC63_07820 [Euryarchaeota archaeon TMED103]RAH11569.1 MAG: hypothetical protein CMA18_003440 [Euryarchaeota archaeon]